VPQAGETQAGVDRSLHGGGDATYDGPRKGGQCSDDRGEGTFRGARPVSLQAFPATEQTREVVTELLGNVIHFTGVDCLGEDREDGPSIAFGIIERHLAEISNASNELDRTYRYRLRVQRNTRP
jgi:hypothetical protein